MEMKSVPTKCEQIEGKYYCSYCGEIVIPEFTYDDCHVYGKTLKCSCAGANEAAEIKSQQKALKDRLKQLAGKADVRKKLDRLKYQAAVREAARRYGQPSPVEKQKG